MGTSNKRADPERQEYVVMPLDQILEHPKNPHIGDDDAVGRSIAANGFYGAVVVQASTGYLLAGHTRYRSMLAKGAATIPVIKVYVDDERALQILLDDNRANQFGRFDESLLMSALDELATAGQLTTSLYDQGFLDDLKFALSETEVGYGKSAGLDAGNASFDPSFEERADKYAANGVRSIILDFTIEDFEKLTPRLQAARSRHGVETNAALFEALLAIDEEEAELAEGATA